MLNLDSKNSSSCQISSIPRNFQSTAGALRHDHLFDLHVIVFIKNGRITTSAPIILSNN